MTIALIVLAYLLAGLTVAAVFCEFTTIDTSDADGRFLAGIFAACWPIVVLPLLLCLILVVLGNLVQITQQATTAIYRKVKSKRSANNE